MANFVFVRFDLRLSNLPSATSFLPDARTAFGLTSFLCVFPGVALKRRNDWYSLLQLNGGRHNIGTSVLMPDAARSCKKVICASAEPVDYVG